jgi:Ca2+/Na+ antiporter
MVKVSDEQVDFILHEIEARGVTIEDLQWNLLDHMCCIIEHEMSEKDDFNEFFKRLLPRFFNDNLREIQEETELLLTFKHFYAMKKTVNISGLLAAILTLMGSVLKVFHLPGASICFVLGIAFFSLIFLPLMIALKFRDEGTKTDKLVLSFGFLVGIITSLGFLFKLMHWPGANMLMLSGLVSFTFVYVPIYFFSRIRRPELKFNTTVNSVLMMACGGLLFAMYNLGYNTKVEESSQQAYRLLNEEVQKMSQSRVVSVDSTDVKSLHSQIAALDGEISMLKSEIIRSSTHLTKQEYDAMPEDEAFSRLPKEEAMTRILNVSIQGKWDEIGKLIEQINGRLKAAYPEQKDLVFEISSIDLASNTTKIALQNLTLIQMHLRLLKLIAS